MKAAKRILQWLPVLTRGIMVSRILQNTKLMKKDHAKTRGIQKRKQLFLKNSLNASKYSWIVRGPNMQVT